MQDRILKFKTEKEYKMFMKKKGRKPENPAMRCKNFRKESPVIPDNCYNCYMRKGYPYYLGGDESCENFVEGKPQ